MGRDVTQGLIERLDEDVRALLLLRMPGEAGRLARLVAVGWREACGALEREQHGHARETRPCPHCSRLGMPGATRCGYCWRTLVPLPESPAHGAHARRGDGHALAALDRFEDEGGALGRGRDAGGGRHELRS